VADIASHLEVSLHTLSKTQWIRKSHPMPSAKLRLEAGAVRHWAKVIRCSLQNPG
jgi:hypothetical protein